MTQTLKTTKEQIVTRSDGDQQTLHIYNSLTGEKHVFRSIEEGKAGMYVCGVTVYDDAHIGHGMSSIVFDVIRRYLIHLGYVVRYVQNFTDIDDRIIQRAALAGVSVSEFTARKIDDWSRQIAALNILPANVNPRATHEIPEIIDMIATLIRKGHAYQSGGDVYFRVRSFAGYGKLSHRSVDNLLTGVRVDVLESKEDPLDFALWKAAKPAEPRWESPWGPGRPGWHIECSAMCTHHLNGIVDVHGGGRDLIFPHHENEIAQSEALSGSAPYAQFWLHNGMLQLNGEKMSKSLGNVIGLEEIIDLGRAAAFRVQVLQTHYRAPLNFTRTGLEAAETGLSRLRTAANPSSDACVRTGSGSDANSLIGLSGEVRKRFHNAMLDDFDTPSALAALFELGRSINRARAEGISIPAVEEAQVILRELADILGVDLTEPEIRTREDITPLVDLLISVRNQLRTHRHFEPADQIRVGLSDLGILLEDSPTGTTWRRR